VRFLRFIGALIAVTVTRGGGIDIIVLAFTLLNFFVNCVFFYSHLIFRKRKNLIIIKIVIRNIEYLLYNGSIS
jgi:hypothetical protein